MKKIVVLSLFLASGLSGSVLAQTTDYTQYNESTLFTNPSGVGTRNEARVTAQYRGQELAPGEQTTHALLTGVYPLLDKTKTERKGGIGFSLLRDAQGQDETLMVQGLAAAYAYNLAIGRKQYVSFGMQAGYFQQRLSIDAVTTGSQWTDLNGFDAGLPIGEALDRERKGFLTLGAGFTYYKEDEDGRHISSLGVAAFHLNRPDVSLTANEALLGPGYGVQGYMALLRNEDWHIGPEANYRYGHGQLFFQAGAVARHYFTNRNPFDMLKDGFIAFRGGYREEQYASMGVELQQPGFRVGISYDIGVGGTAAPGNAIEVTFSLRRLFKKKQPAVTTNYTLGEVKDIYFGDRESKPQENRDGELSIAREKGDYTLALRQDFKFEFNKTDLKDEAKAYLDELASLLKANPATQLEVIGHTDDVGTVVANRKVSMGRAEAAINYLIEQGIDPKRLKATAKGNSEPLVPNGTEADRAINRRIEFVIYE